MDAAPVAVVTGASTGIGFALARLCARHGYDLVIAANEPAIHSAAEALRQTGVLVKEVEVDLATKEGV
jgi:short-subunit dehydrogenase